MNIIERLAPLNAGGWILEEWKNGDARHQGGALDARQTVTDVSLDSDLGLMRINFTAAPSLVMPLTGNETVCEPLDIDAANLDIAVPPAYLAVEDPSVEDGAVLSFIHPATEVRNQRRIDEALTE